MQACQFAVQAVQDMKQTPYMTTRGKKVLGKKQKKKMLLFPSQFLQNVQRGALPPTTTTLSALHLLLPRGGWQDMKRCRPLTETDHFLAGSAAVYFPIWWLTAFIFSSPPPSFLPAHGCNASAPATDGNKAPFPLNRVPLLLTAASLLTNNPHYED